MATKTAARIGIEIGAAFAGSFTSVFGKAQSEVGKMGTAIKQLETRQKELNKVISDQQKLGANGSALKALYSQQELDQITQKIIRLRNEQAKLTAAGAGVNRGKGMMRDAGFAIGAVAATAATMGFPIVQAASFETAMLGVAKQVEGARDSSGKLTNVYYEMAQQVKMLGREIPLTTNNLAEMVASGARMGIAKNDLIEFTKTAAMMASAFDLPAAELAEQMGKISVLYKIPIPAISKLADTINYLDDNAAGNKASDIIDYLTRVGGVAGAVKITGNEMAALGSTLLTLGERSESASTATNAMFQKFAAADKGTKKFKEAMKEIGLSTDAVQKGMQKNAQGTLLSILDAVAKMPEEKRLGVMVELVGLEHSDTMAKLVGNMEEYRKQIALTNNEAANGSMAREFAALLATTNAQWTITKNNVVEVGNNIGAVLLPAVNSTLTSFNSLSSSIADFVRGNETLIGNVTTVVGTIGGIFAASKIAAFGIGAVTFAFNALKLAMMTNPIGLALTALSVAGVLLWKNWEGVKGGLVAIWQTIKETAIAAFDAIKSSVGAVIDWLAQKTEWIFKTVDAVKLAANSVGDGIGNAWSGAKSFIGIGGGNASPAAAAPGTAPAVAVPAGRVAPVVNQTSQTTNNITVQGAADPAATAKAVTFEMDRREREKAAGRRSMMSDSLGY